MKVIAIDDEEISLEYLTFQLEQVKQFTEIKSFKDPKEVLVWLETHTADIAFVDIIMPGMNGLTLCSKIKNFCPECKVIFVSSSKEFALDAFHLHASGYIVKPITRKEIENELEFILENSKYSKPFRTYLLKAQCFGNFEIFHDENPIHFRYRKTKELLAYLIDRKGATCSVNELASILYEGKENSPALQSQIRNLTSDLKSTLAKLSADTLLVKNYGLIGIYPDKIKCDYYDALAGNKEAIKLYNKEYMSQYSWAKSTNDYLNEALTND